MRLLAAFIGLASALVMRDAGAEERRAAPEDEFFATLGVGIGGPMGGSSLPIGFSSGVAGLFGLGYVVVPHVSTQLFVQFEDVAMASDTREREMVGDSQGSFALGGFELRGSLGAGPMTAWVGAGIAFGGGRLQVEIDFLQSPVFYEADFGPSPLLSMGFDLQVVEGLGIGPSARWYVLELDRACETRENGFSFFVPGSEPPTPKNPYYYPAAPPAVITRERVCTDSPGNESVPDALYIGIGLTATL